MNVNILNLNWEPYKTLRNQWEIDRISLESDRKYALDWKVGDKPLVLQFGFGTITKIDYETGEVWVDNLNENWLPIKASSLYLDESYT